MQRENQKNKKIKLHIKKGDIVKVVAGDDKGQQGRILAVYINKQRALVEGVNLISKHSKPTTENPKGGIIKKEAPIHISNLMVVDSSGKPTRIGRKLDVKGKLVRYSKKTGEELK
ncbi:MAG: 50S ribosomal protein L24 [Bacteroidetes bacterium GWE2_29_8]|nr:MAG: 50S ribosomal protein L24 [Bacteroidetes bacterium GWE2_29_8]OFY21198.1 MAG: 50S ribosomal protein L24 [Bacteroidetes bacterium GWF2_29_10]